VQLAPPNDKREDHGHLLTNRHARTASLINGAEEQGLVTYPQILYHS